MHKQLDIVFQCAFWCCDLLKIAYLCRCINNLIKKYILNIWVVICLKLLTFVVHKQLVRTNKENKRGCDLLKIAYLCRCINNIGACAIKSFIVVICLKLLTFVGA